jgi:hypothetical protein
MIKSHLKQYVSMVKELLHYGTDDEDSHGLMEEVTICQIESILLELEKANIDYTDFIEGILEIRKNTQTK